MGWEKRYLDAGEDPAFEFFQVLDSGRVIGPYTTDNIQLLDAIAHDEKSLPKDHWIKEVPFVPSVIPTPTSQDIIDVAKRKLIDLDGKSIRPIREVLLTVFADQPELISRLKALEDQAIPERAKIPE